MEPIFVAGDRIAPGQDPCAHLIDLRPKLRRTNYSNRPDNTLMVQAMRRN